MLLVVTHVSGDGMYVVWVVDDLSACSIRCVVPFWCVKPVIVVYCCALRRHTSVPVVIFVPSSARAGAGTGAGEEVAHRAPDGDHVHLVDGDTEEVLAPLARRGAVRVVVVDLGEQVKDLLRRGVVAVEDLLDLVEIGVDRLLLGEAPAVRDPRDGEEEGRAVARHVDADDAHSVLAVGTGGGSH
jgi:hypothetical protein